MEVQITEKPMGKASTRRVSHEWGMMLNKLKSKTRSRRKRIVSKQRRQKLKGETWKER